MIPTVNRFHGHNSLRATYSRGQAVRGPLCSIKYAHNPRRKHYRLAVVVSKKVCKSAVKRNRVRRRIYEIIRSNQLIQGVYDVVITVFSDQIADMPTEDLRRVLRAQLHQAGLDKSVARS